MIFADGDLMWHCTDVRGFTFLQLNLRGKQDTIQKLGYSAV